MIRSNNQVSPEGPFQGQTAKDQKLIKLLYLEPEEMSMPVYFEPDEVTIPVYFEADEITVPVYFEADEVMVPVYFESDEISVPVYFEQDEITVPVYFEQLVKLDPLRFTNFGWNTFYPEIQSASCTILYARNMGIQNDRNLMAPFKKVKYTANTAVIGESVALDMRSDGLALSAYQYTLSYAVFWAHYYDGAGTTPYDLNSLSLIANTSMFFTNSTDTGFVGTPVPYHAKSSIDITSSITMAGVGPLIFPIIHKSTNVISTTNHPGSISFNNSSASLAGYWSASGKVLPISGMPSSLLGEIVSRFMVTDKHYAYNNDDYDEKKLTISWWFQQLNVAANKTMLIEYTSRISSSQLQNHLVVFSGTHIDNYVRFYTSSDPDDGHNRDFSGPAIIKIALLDDVSNFDAALALEAIYKAGGETIERRAYDILRHIKSNYGNDYILTEYTSAAYNRYIVYSEPGVALSTTSIPVHKVSTTVSNISTAGFYTKDEWNKVHYILNNTGISTGDNQIIETICYLAKLDGKDVSMLRLDPVEDFDFVDEGKWYLQHRTKAQTPSWADLDMSLILVHYDTEGQQPLSLAISGTAGAISSVNMDSKQVYIHTKESDGVTIFDPVLWLDKRLVGNAYAVQLPIDDVMSYESLQLTSSALAGEDSVANNIEIRSTAGILKAKSELVARKWVVFSPGFSDEEADNAVSIKMIHTLSSKYNLSIVSNISINKEVYYFGILDTTSKQHYSPINITNGTLTFSSVPEINAVHILSANETEFSFILDIETESKELSLYFKLLTQAKLFNNTDTSLRMLLYEYVICDNQLRIPTSFAMDDGLTAPLQIASTNPYMARCSPVIYNTDIAIHSDVVFPRRLYQSDAIMIYSNGILEKSSIILHDMDYYVSQSISIPCLLPMWHASGAIVPYVYFADYNDTGTDEKMLKSALYFMNNNCKACYYDISTMMFASTPPIDSTIGVFSALPMNIKAAFGVDSIGILNEIGTSAHAIDSAIFTKYNDNLYKSSSGFKLVKSNTIPIMDATGKVFVVGNYIFAVNGMYTYAYAIDQFAKANYLTTISAVLLCKPIKIGEQLILVCNLGLYTLSDGMFYEFSSQAESAIVRPSETGGYLICVKQAETTDIYVGIAAESEFISIGEQAPTITSECLLWYRLGFDMSISQLSDEEYSALNASTSYTINDVDKLANAVEVCDMYQGFSDGYLVNITHTADMNGSYPDRNNSDDFNGLIVTSPQTFINQEAKTFYASSIMVDVIAMISSDMVLSIYDNNNDVALFTTSASITTGNKVINFNVNNIAWKSMYLTIECRRPDGTGNISIRNISLVGSWQDEESFDLT